MLLLISEGFSSTQFPEGRGGERRGPVVATPCLHSVLTPAGQVPASLHLQVTNMAQRGAVLAPRPHSLGMAGQMGTRPS